MDKQSAADVFVPRDGCPHGEYLICTDHQCGRCGWNPEVAEERLRKMGIGTGKEEN